jgi:acyl homoserine lactone synthase
MAAKVAALGRKDGKTIGGAHAMLKLIEGSYASFFPREMDAMFRSRAETFHERLGWEVEVKNGYERDRFDDLNPLYLVSVDPDTEAYQGSVRLLPTSGPNMLRDVFPQLMGDEVIESATIWEASRICAAKTDGDAAKVPHATFIELIVGMGEVARLAGLTQVVTVVDARILRLLRALDCPHEVVGVPQRIGGVMSYAILFDVSGFNRSNFRDRHGLPKSVLSPGAAELAFA